MWCVNDVLAQRFVSNRTGSGIGGTIVLAIFGMFWCSLVGAFDFIAIRGLVLQLASAHYVPTPAHIIKSDVVSHRGSKGGTTYGTVFDYTYTVNGAILRGNRYTFNISSSSDRNWANDAVAAFPVGSDRVCYYDPANPTRAVLAPGVHGSDLVILMFLTPFNIIAFFLASLPIWNWREGRRPALVAPRISDPLHGREGYAMLRFNPGGRFLGLLLVMSFVGIFVVIIRARSHPTIAWVLFVWGTAFAVALGVTIYSGLRAKSGRFDLVIDYESRSITIPAMYGRKSVERIPMSDVKGFAIESVVANGSNRNRNVKWQVKLIDRADGEIVVQEGFWELNARRLSETLNAKLNA